MMKINRVNWFYIFIGLLLIFMLYISARYFKGSGNASIGIAMAQDYKITSEKSAFIKSVHAVPGMQVKAGDLLIELSSQELEVEIAKQTNRISSLKLELAEKSKLADAQISYIRAENSIVQEELEAGILQTSSEMKMNESLTKEFVPTSAKQEENPALIKINSLKEQKLRQQLASDIKTKDVLQINATAKYLLANQIILQESELKLLQDANIKLNKYASAPGVIQSVLVKPGEQVNAFTPLLTINPLHPTMVILYLVGQKENLYSIGASVSVSSYDHRSNAVTGKVIGYGSVTGLPEILQKSTAVKAFGQEVFIELPEASLFSNGEKVLIR